MPASVDLQSAPFTIEVFFFSKADERTKLKHLMQISIELSSSKWVAELLTADPRRLDKNYPTFYLSPSTGHFFYTRYTGLLEFLVETNSCGRY